jgi:hypothetical protein
MRWRPCQMVPPQGHRESTEESVKHTSVEWTTSVDAHDHCRELPKISEPNNLSFSVIISIPLFILLHVFSA